MTHFIFDVDDVLLDWQTGFSHWLAECDLHVNPAGPQSWDLAEWIGCTSNQAKRLVADFNASAAFGNLKALPHARDVVWALRDAGHTISVLTACGDGRNTQVKRLLNLLEHFGGNLMLDITSDGHDRLKGFASVTFLPLGASKFDHLYSASRSNAVLIFIEDNFKHAQSGVVNGIKSYCLRRSHNRRCEAENPDSGVIWIDSLLDLPIN